MHISSEWTADGQIFHDFVDLSHVSHLFLALTIQFLTIEPLGRLRHKEDGAYNTHTCQKDADPHMALPVLRNVLVIEGCEYVGQPFIDIHECNA